MAETVRVTWDDAQFQAAFVRLRELGARTGPLMADVAEGLLQSTQERFVAGVAPDGTPWAELRPSTKRMKRGPGILRETGQLAGTLSHSWGDEFAELVASAYYAKWHQTGTNPYVIRPTKGKALAIPGIAEGPATQEGAGPTLLRRSVQHPGLPPRPFMGVARDDVQMIQDAVEEAFRRALGG